jgi:DNA-binding phage protein
MALTFDEKIAIAKLKAEGLTPYAIAKQLGIRREKIYRALKADKELQDLCNDLTTDCNADKKTAAENAKQALKDLYINKGKELVDRFYKLIDVPEELIESSSLRDRMGAAKLMLEMVENIANVADEAQIDDESAASIEIIVEDASGGE